MEDENSLLHSILTPVVVVYLPALAAIMMMDMMDT